MRKKLGELLIERGVITPKQLSEALELQRRRGHRLGAALVLCGHIDETQLVSALSDLLKIKVVDLTRIAPDPRAIQMVKHSFAAQNDLFPYAQRWERGSTHLTVAMADPMNYRVIDELGFITNANIEPVLARPSDVDRAIRKHYGSRVAAPGGFAPLRLDSNPGSAEMTIVRGPGQEETINMETGEIISPFAKTKAEEPKVEAAKLENAPVNLPPDSSTGATPEISAVLLTEEVDEDVPVDAVSGPLPANQAPRSGQPPHLSVANQGGMSHETPIPLTAVKQRPNVGREPDTNPYFNEALGALIDAAGEAVNAESFVRLERKFWALMRVLAKKGILTNEDFIKELGEDER